MDRNKMRSALVCVTALMLVVLSLTPAHATHPFEQYSILTDQGRGAYTGLYNHREEIIVVGGTPGPCPQTPYMFRPVFTTQWVVMNAAASEWVEIGTGHQCDPDMRYWFWGYGWNNTWFPKGEQWTGIVSGFHYFEIRRWNHFWDFVIDGQWKGDQYSNTIGLYAEVGLESENGHTGTPYYVNDTMNVTFQEGPWTPFSYSRSQVGPALCGVILAQNAWKAKQPSAATGGC